jgi:hypothetical protein
MNIDLPLTALDAVNEQTPTYIESKKLPPSYSQLYLNKEEVVISKQPTSTKNLQDKIVSLSDLSFTGYERNHQYKIGYATFNTSDDYMAFTDSTNNRLAALCIKPMVKIANKDKVISKINLTKISSLPLKSMSLSPDNQKLLLAFEEGNNKQIYLVENNNPQQKIAENADFNKTTKLSCPLKQLTSVDFDINGNIYAVGIKNNNLLEVYKLLPEDNINWSLDLQLTTDGIYNACFSRNKLYLYTLSKKNMFETKQNILSIYSRNNNFKLVAEVENTTMPPADIDSACETLIFIDNKTLILKSLVDNSEVSTDLSNKINHALFIPKTKDILLFDSDNQVILLKCNSDKKLSYYIKDTHKLGIEVKHAFFDPNDNNNLRVIASNSNKYKDMFLFKAGITGMYVAVVTASPVFYVLRHNYYDQMLNLLGSESAVKLALFYGWCVVGITSALLGMYCSFVTNDIYAIKNTQKINYKIKNSDDEDE